MIFRYLQSQVDDLSTLNSYILTVLLNSCQFLNSNNNLLFNEIFLDCLTSDVSGSILNALLASSKTEVTQSDGNIPGKWQDIPLSMDSVNLMAAQSRARFVH